MSDSLWTHGLHSLWNSQARILECIAFPFFRDSSQPRGWIQVSYFAGGFFLPTELPGKPKYSRLSISWRIHEPQLDNSHINGHHGHFKPKKQPVLQSSYIFAHVLHPWAIKNEASCHYTLLLEFPLCPSDSLSSRYLILHIKEIF